MTAWRFRGQRRPSFAKKPMEGQESVWDYPRPPIIERSNRYVEVRYNGKIIASSKETCRVLETASPPGIYIPSKDVNWELLTQTRDRSICEWKGTARYWALSSAPDEIPVGWSYHDPARDFIAIKDHISFYPGRVDCYVDGEKVNAQPGHFYGGWISKDIQGPFKGEPGTGHW